MVIVLFGLLLTSKIDDPTLPPANSKINSTAFCNAGITISGLPLSYLNDASVLSPCLWLFYEHLQAKALSKKMCFVLLLTPDFNPPNTPAYTFLFHRHISLNHLYLTFALFRLT